MEKNGNGKKKLMKHKIVKKTDSNKEQLNTGVSGKKYGKKEKKKSKIVWKIFKVCIFVFLALGIIGTGVVVGVVTGIIDKTDSVDLESLELLKLTSFVYDRNGNQIGSYHDTENRVSVKYEELPKNLVDAVVAIEDERFFSHKGIDVKRTIGAIGTFILNGGKSNFGGSTITQQLVKNATEDKETSWTRKIREWYRAITLEQKLKKEKIFESYINTIYFGDGASGAEVASQNYFAKSVKELNLAECAVLAAMIQTPEGTNPYNGDEAKARLKRRQEIVLNKMVELGKITKEEADEAKAYELAYKKATIVDKSEIQSYFLDAVFEQVLEDLMEQKGMSRGNAIKTLYNDGLKIYTTQDPNVQKAIDDAYNNDKIFYTDKAGDFMQSAMVVLDHTNGEILGLIGGSGKKETARGLNRATGFGMSNYRQPGSCMKPFAAYGPAFENGVLYPAGSLDDIPYSSGGWNPKNYYGYYFGYVTARQALAYSMNIPAIKANLKVDINSAYLFAKNCGLDTLVEADKSASMAIGGVTKGFTPVQMASAYGTIANGGVRVTPKIYTKVLDRNDKELLVTKSEAKRVMKDSTAYMLTSCLESVVKPGNPNGTAYGYVRVGNIAVAGKTGNTDNDKDQWFCGFTPYYTIACWNGYDDPKPINRPYPYASMRLFNTVMNAICQGKEAKQFERPASIVNASVCNVSGLVATDACKADQRGDRTVNDIFASGTIPTKTCDIHKMVKVCKQTGVLANEFCPDTEERSFISRDIAEPNIKPSDWQYMVPTLTCQIHTKPEEKPPVEEPEDPDVVDPYSDGEDGKDDDKDDKKKNNN